MLVEPVVDVIFVSPRTARLLAIPTPPSIAKAPPVNDDDPKTTLVEFLIDEIPPTFKFLTIATPPSTINAPVVVDVDCVASLILTNLLISNNPSGSITIFPVSVLSFVASILKLLSTTILPNVPVPTTSKFKDVVNPVTPNVPMVATPTPLTTRSCSISALFISARLVIVLLVKLPSVPLNVGAVTMSDIVTPLVSVSNLILSLWYSLTGPSSSITIPSSPAFA